MNYSTIEKQYWKVFFDMLTRRSRGQQIQVEIANPEIGDQIEEEWILLRGFSYDEKSDVLYVASESLEHPIQSPQEIIIIEDGATIRALGVKDKDENLQIIEFKEPLLLDAPENHAETPRP